MSRAVTNGRNDVPRTVDWAMHPAPKQHVEGWSP